VKRGKIRWYTFQLPDKRRPVLILTRNEVVDRLNEIIVVPATRTIRGLTSEVVLTADDGMPAACALNFDHASLARRKDPGRIRGGAIRPARAWKSAPSVFTDPKNRNEGYY
jgi:mRNA interferase MazF